MLVDPSTEDVLREGDILKLPALGKTLRVLQTDPDALYTGVLADWLVQDLAHHGSIITKQDLANYKYSKHSVIIKLLTRYYY